MKIVSATCVAAILLLSTACNVSILVAVSTTLVCTMLEAFLKEDLERRTQQLLEERKADEKEADKARLQTRLVEERRKAKNYHAQAV